MELFRHYFTAEEWATSIFFTQHLNDFGFCNLDGSPVTAAWNTSNLSVRYSLDNQQKTYLNTSPNRSTPPSFNPILSNNTQSYWQNLKWYSDAMWSYDWETRPATVFFIPLINKGFFLHLRAHNYYDSSDVSEYSNDKRDKTFSLNTPTPNLNIKIYDTSGTANTGYGVLNFIGIPPSSGNSLNWTYLCYTSNQYFSVNLENSGFTHHLIDYGGGRVTDMPFRSGYTRDYNDGNPISENNLTYTNVNANVCSLIKMPFDTGYIDNIYLLATAPKSLEDGTFFSFNGRNFLNVFENYVLELPST